MIKVHFQILKYMYIAVVVLNLLNYLYICCLLYIYYVDEAEASGGMNDALRQKLVDTLMMVLSSGSDEECAICLDSLKQPIITCCAHVFCRGCIEAVIKNETVATIMITFKVAAFPK